MESRRVAVTSLEQRFAYLATQCRGTGIVFGATQILVSIVIRMMFSMTRKIRAARSCPKTKFYETVKLGT